MTLGQMIQQAQELSARIDEGVKAMTGAGQEYAQAEHDYRIAKAKAWVKAPAGTVPEREAWVNAETADERRARDLAESMRTAAWEALRARRAQLSALQSILSAHKAEADLAKYGPGVTP